MHTGAGSIMPTTFPASLPQCLVKYLYMVLNNHFLSFHQGCPTSRVSTLTAASMNKPSIHGRVSRLFGISMYVIE